VSKKDLPIERKESYLYLCDRTDGKDELKLMNTIPGKYLPGIGILRASELRAGVWESIRINKSLVVNKSKLQTLVYYDASQEMV
jgi:hypothetical protein